MRSSCLSTLIFWPIICAEYQERQLIRQLNRFYNFDHNVFLLDKLVNVNRFIDTGRKGDFTPQSVYVFDNSGGNFSGVESFKITESKVTFLIVASENIQYEANSNILNQVMAIQRHQINIKIGLFATISTLSGDDLQKLFEWSWNNKIVNIFAVISTSPRTINIFTYNPFGTFTVLNLTDSVDYGKFFFDQTANLKGHVVRMGAPFNYYNNEKLWLAVFRMMNASFRMVENNCSAIAEYFANDIDFVPRIFFNEKSVEMSMYPIDVIPMVIVVPEAQPYSSFTAYIQTVTSDQFFGYALITIVLTMLLLGIVRYIQQKTIFFFRSVTDVLNLLLNDNASINYGKLSVVECCLIVPLTFMGFIIVNGILSNLTSYLTKPQHQPQVNSVEDIYRSENPISVWNEHWQHKLATMLTMQSNHTDWSDKVVVRDGLLLFEQFTLFNRSVSFLEDLNYVKSLLRIQKRLNIKGYHIPDARMYKYLLTYPINRAFPFTDRFNEIVGRIVSAGLYDRWLREAVGAFEQDVVKKNLKVLKVREGIDRFPVPVFIVYGWIASIIVFAVESIWKRLKLSRR